MTPRVLEAVSADETIDVLVLSEYRVPLVGDLIAERLHASGWGHQVRGAIPAGKKGVTVFSRCTIAPAPSVLDDGGEFSQWLVPARLPKHALTVVGAYVPYEDGPLKESIWRAIHVSAERHRDHPLLILGDFNSCHPHEADSGVGYTTHALKTMERHTIDLWRFNGAASSKRDHITWQGPNGKGNRLDFAFCTPALSERVLTTRHLHDLRISKASDHSGVLVEITCPT